ncbi:MAG: hypothetical protein ACSHYB_00805 [Roseibacillus sp.]
MNASLVDLLRRISDAEVECILIGGMAANVHGSTLATFDCVVVVVMTPENLTKI